MKPGLLFVLAGAGALAYWYFNQKTATGIPVGSATPGAGTTTTTPPPPQASPLQTIYNRMAAQEPVGTALSPWQWNYVLATSGNVVPPDPTVLWPGITAANFPSLTLAQYWNAMGPWLTTNAGLSGLGWFA